MEQHTSVNHPIAKIVTAWLAGIGVSSWSDFAAMCAATYSVLLIGEWLWKRFGRPYAEARGWVVPRLRRKADK